jgi:hypothetical protein
MKFIVAFPLSSLLHHTDQGELLHLTHGSDSPTNEGASSGSQLADVIVHGAHSFMQMVQQQTCTRDAPPQGGCSAVARLYILWHC